MAKRLAELNNALDLDPNAVQTLIARHDEGAGSLATFGDASFRFEVVEPSSNQSL